MPSTDRYAKRWTHAEVAELLVSNNALTSITPEHALAFAEHMRPARVKAGSVIFKEGVKDQTFMVFILSGEAVVEHSASGHANSTVLRVVGEGNIIGEMGLMDNKARSATVTATSDMDLAVMDQKTFADLIAKSPALGCSFLGAMLQSVSVRLRDANRRIVVLDQINRSLQAEADTAKATPETTFRESAPAPTRPLENPSRVFAISRVDVPIELPQPSVQPDVVLDDAARVDVGASVFNSKLPIADYQHTFRLN